MKFYDTLLFSCPLIWEQSILLLCFIYTTFIIKTCFAAVKALFLMQWGQRWATVRKI